MAPEGPSDHRDQASTSSRRTNSLSPTSSDLLLSRTKGDTLGTLTDVMETGANDVYCVKTPEGKGTSSPGDPRLHSRCGS